MTAPEKEFVLTHTFKNVSSIEEGGFQYSTPEKHFNIPWKFWIARKSGNLACYMQCDQPRGTSDWSRPLSIKAEWTTILMAVTEKCQRLTKDYTFKSDERSGIGSSAFMKWEEMEKDYMIDGNITFETHVKIKKMSGIPKENLRDFNVKDEIISDFLLIVDHQEFYVSKSFLASQSMKFKSLLLGKSKEILIGIKSSDFQNFLELLYGESPIDEDTIDGIIHVADMYDAMTAIQKCEHFLIEKSEKTMKEKLQVAKKYKLENLKIKSLSKISTIDEIRSVLSSDLKEMDPSVIEALLQKSLALNP